MTLLASILVPIILLTIFIFFSTTPKHVRKREKIFYNLMVCSFGIIGCVGISLYSYFTTGQSVDSAWWSVGAFFGSIIIFTATLIIGGIYRNLFHFNENIK